MVVCVSVRGGSLGLTPGRLSQVSGQAAPRTAGRRAAPLPPGSPEVQSGLESERPAPEPVGACGSLWEPEIKATDLQLSLGGAGKMGA